MKQAQQFNLRPRISSAKRMDANPTDWSAFEVGDNVGVFLGNCWRKALIVEIFDDYAVVEGKHLASTQTSRFNVYDARNIVQAAELITVTTEEPTLFTYSTP